jgi:hypothetical protein
LDRLFFLHQSNDSTYNDISELVKAPDTIPLGSNTLVTRLLDVDITWYDDDLESEEDAVI